MLHPKMYCEKVSSPIMKTIEEKTMMIVLRNRLISGPFSNKRIIPENKKQTAGLNLSMICPNKMVTKEGKLNNHPAMMRQDTITVSTLSDLLMRIRFDFKLF